MELQEIHHYSAVKTEGLKITLQKKPKVSPVGVHKEVPKEREEEQSSPRKKDLDCIQTDDHSACIRRPCGPDLPDQSTRKRPLEQSLQPTQSSQVALDTSVNMPPVKAQRLPSVGTPPVTSANRAPKRKSGPLMRKAKRMVRFLQKRCHRPQGKGFQRSVWPGPSSGGPSPAPPRMMGLKVFEKEKKETINNSGDPAQSGSAINILCLENLKI